MNNKPRIIKIDSGNPGKTVAIFGGVHGNEKAGILAVDYLINNLEIERGVVYLVHANPKAINQNVRFLEKNLNRCFLKREKSRCYEEFLADELMSVLDECDALLDLHAYRDDSDRDITFAFCADNALELASKMHISKVITNIDPFEKGGSDGYMYNNGKIGICVELGSLRHREKFKDLGIKTSYQFLQFFDLIETKIPFDSISQDIMEMHYLHEKQTKDFKFTKDYLSFDKVSSGEIIANDTDEIIMNIDGYIIFPSEKGSIGADAFLFAKEK
jgi:succinylglutamate desuccinylase